MCKVNGFTNHVLCTASLLNLFVISIDRYYAIFHPLRYQEKLTTRRAVVLIALSWGYGFVTAILPLIGWGRYMFEPGIWLCVTDFKYDASFSYFIIGSVYVFPLTVMMVIYYKIFKVAYRHTRAIRQQEDCAQYGANDKMELKPYATVNEWMMQVSRGSMSVSQSRNSIGSKSRTSTCESYLSTAERVRKNAESYRTFEARKSKVSTNGINNGRRRNTKLFEFKREVRTGIVLALIVVIFVVSWTPFSILNLWLLHTKSKPPLIGEAIVSRLAYLNSAVNPPLYCLMNKTIKKSFQRIWFNIFSILKLDKVCCCVKDEDTEICEIEHTSS